VIKSEVEDRIRRFLGVRPPSGVAIGALADGKGAPLNFYVSNVVGGAPTTALAGERDPQLSGHSPNSSNSGCKKVRCATVAFSRPLRLDNFSRGL
jgi:hypothetical protein